MTGVQQAAVERLLETAAAARAKRGTRGLARIVVLGEFNSGKTTLVNAILGADVLPAGIATRTELPAIVQFGSRISLSIKLADGRRVPRPVETFRQSPMANARAYHYRAPLAVLRRVTVVDTPASGLEATAVEQHVANACRGADLVVWCTPAMQAWKYSEQLLWLTLPAALRKRGMLAVTFADQVAEADLDRLLARLHADAGSYFTDIVILAGTPPRDEDSAVPFAGRLREGASQN